MLVEPGNGDDEQRWRFDMRTHLAVTSEKTQHEGDRTRDIQVGNRGSEAAAEEQPDKLWKTVRFEQGALVHTLTCRTHIFLRTARSLRTSHIFMRVTHTHGSRLKCHEKGFGRMRMWFSTSPSLSLISPILRCSCTLTSRPVPTTSSLIRHPHELAVLSRPKSEGHAPLRTCIAKFGYLAKSEQTQVMSPRSSTRSLPWTMTRCSSTTRTTNSPTSRKTHARTMDNLVFTQCLNPLCRSVLTMILLFRQKVKKACNREPLAGHREIEEREGFVIKVAASMSKKSRLDSIRSYSLQTLILLLRVTENLVLNCLSENSILTDEISENIFDEELNKPRTSSTKSSTSREHLRRRAQQAFISGISIYRSSSAREYICGCREIEELRVRCHEEGNY